MSQQYPFTPAYGTGITVAPTVSSARSTHGRGYKQLVISNIGSVNCYVKPLTDSGSASSEDYLILPNSQVVITKDKKANMIAYISETGTGSLHIIAGEGF